MCSPYFFLAGRYCKYSPIFVQLGIQLDHSRQPCFPKYVIMPRGIRCGPGALLCLVIAGYPGPLCPAPASLVPTLWARYFLRWQGQGRPDLGPGQLAALDPVEGLATQFENAVVASKKVRQC